MQSKLSYRTKIERSFVRFTTSSHLPALSTLRSEDLSVSMRRLFQQVPTCISSVAWPTSSRWPNVAATSKLMVASRATLARGYETCRTWVKDENSKVPDNGVAFFDTRASSFVVYIDQKKKNDVFRELRHAKENGVPQKKFSIFTSQTCRPR